MMTHQNGYNLKNQSRKSARQEWKLLLRTFIETSLIVAGLFAAFVYVGYLVVEHALPVYVGF